MAEEWYLYFKQFVNQRNQKFLQQPFSKEMVTLLEEPEKSEIQKWKRVEEENKDRKVKLRKAKSHVQINKVVQESPIVKVFYTISTKLDMEHYNQEYTQQMIEQRLCILKNKGGWWVVSDRVVEEEGKGLIEHPAPLDMVEDIYNVNNPNDRRVAYNREQAVQYAHRWWNDYNPKFKAFEVDCTNYVSQCMRAGNAPMKSSSNRAKGWWYKFGENPNWSFSWAVAHSFRWYLPNSKTGLRATEAFSADQLQLGDIICYDFDGDGKWQHNTIVVAKDGAGMPLVNAHTTNSQNRYWSYKDSSAWTEKIQYKFLKIVDQF